MVTAETIGHHEKTPKIRSKGSANTTAVSPALRAHVMGVGRDGTDVLPTSVPTSTSCLTADVPCLAGGPDPRPGTGLDLSAAELRLARGVGSGEQLVDVGVLVRDHCLNDREQLGVQVLHRCG